MKVKKLFSILLLPFLTACSINLGDYFNNATEENTQNNEENENQNKDIEEVDLAALENAKQVAVEELSNFVKLSKYRSEQQTQISAYISQGTRVINACKSIDEVFEILELYEGYILEIKTDAQLTLEEQQSIVFTTNQIEEYKALGYSPVYKDSNFRKGFNVTKTVQNPGESFYYDTYINPFNTGVKPDWTMAQWNSNYDILGSKDNDGYTLSRSDDGYTNTYTSKGKIIDGQVIPAKKFSINSLNGEIYLEENGRAEYEHARKSGEDWPCLLFEQGFDTSKTKLDAHSSVIIEVDYKVESCINYCGRNYNANNHAAQLLVYLTIQNLSGGFSNPDYGKYIWFGLMLYDNRYDNKTSTIYREHDAGTGTLIYNLSTSEYLKDNNGKCPSVGQRVKAKIDIVPYIKEAMEYSKSRGYLGNTKYEDLYLGGTNFGYEIPGTFDIKSTIYSINVFKK